MNKIISVFKKFHYYFNFFYILKRLQDKNKMMYYFFENISDIGIKYNIG